MSEVQELWPADQPGDQIPVRYVKEGNLEIRELAAAGSAIDRVVAALRQQALIQCYADHDPDDRIRFVLPDRLSAKTATTVLSRLLLPNIITGKVARISFLEVPYKERDEFGKDNQPTQSGGTQYFDAARFAVVGAHYYSPGRKEPELFGARVTIVPRLAVRGDHTPLGHTDRCTGEPAKIPNGTKFFTTSTRVATITPGFLRFFREFMEAK